MNNQSTNMEAKGIKEAVTYLQSLSGRDGLAKVYLNTETNTVEVYHCINDSEHLGEPYVELLSWSCHAAYGEVAPVPTMAQIHNEVMQYAEYLAWRSNNNDTYTSFETYKEFVG